MRDHANAMRYSILYFYILAVFSSCTKSEKPINKFSDPVLIRIADFQDKRLGDSLLKYLSHPQPSYRKNAALAFASLQDSSFVESLSSILTTDSDSATRKAAAFAIGQTPSLASEKALLSAAQTEKMKSVLVEVVEAYGKVSRHWQLNLLADDSIISCALAWSYYRMAVRGKSDDELNRKSSELLKSPYVNTRLGAAHYFARGAENYDAHRKIIIETAQMDTSPEVRMAAILGLRKIKSDSSRRALELITRSDPDYRARVNALRALQEFPMNDTKAVLIEATQGSVSNVGIAAAEAIRSTIQKPYWREVSEIARTNDNWRIQAILYEAALAVSDDKELAEEIKTVYNQSANSYKSASLLSALQHSTSSYRFVMDQLKRPEPVIKVAAATCLVSMNYKKNFDTSLKSEFSKIYQEAIADGDAAVIGIVADALADSTLKYESVIKDISFLKDALARLSLPKDFESILPLETAIAYFEKRKLNRPVRNEFNHPIDWSLAKNISSDQRAIIKTSKGEILIRLMVDEAPGSVTNFVKLALEKYYDGKFFHRVVPNFVVQGGCPRGDGWGSEAYSIRSEFFPHQYKTGSIGMASAGKDTEGTQWFITHSPTPHLEGRYSLFAEVLIGMDVVHKIEVGDRITSVEIINLSAH
ncbi:peptidylprolyl isomerase [Chryseolinea sp. H1M3-3]|uniref:peptidylprolyl isomerase n=1 Tax=Chryseolinea sp. H1M3-3 TaxID=3034144 RepID=UPI0023EA94E1|nr:peptidylprolyl isomerase [Chryseolinea sp. H1M3-3]